MRVTRGRVKKAAFYWRAALHCEGEEREGEGSTSL